MWAESSVLVLLGTEEGGEIEKLKIKMYFLRLISKCLISKYNKNH